MTGRDFLIVALHVWEALVVLYFGAVLAALLVWAKEGR